MGKIKIILYLFLLLLTTCQCSTTTSSNTQTTTTKLVIGIDGGTESIRACCFDATTGRVIGKACAVPYHTNHPHPGWAEQNPIDWYTNLGIAVREAVASTSLPSSSDDSSTMSCTNTFRSYEIAALCVDTTCCSVVALDVQGCPLRPSLLWMDTRSVKQTQEILERCKGDVALEINCGGNGPLSAEWMTPKALWIKQNEPEIWEKACTICEYQDYINWKLTGIMVASSCNAAARWHWNGDECCRTLPSSDNQYPGRPLSMYQQLDLMDLAEKLPQRCIPMGSSVGFLTKEAADHLGLPEGLPVAQVSFAQYTFSG